MNMDKHLGAAREGLGGLEGAGSRRLQAACPIWSRRAMTTYLPLPRCAAVVVKLKRS